jgi:hypothetical protein
LSSTVPSTCAVNSRTMRASLAFMGPPGSRGSARRWRGRSLSTGRVRGLAEG